MKNKKYLAPKNIVSNILLWISALFFLFPIYWIVTGSLKAQSIVLKMPPELVPTNPNFLNYIKLFDKAPIEKWFLNSVIISLASTVLVCTVASLAGYAIAKKSFFGKNFLFWLIIGSMMIPRQLLVVPLFRMMMSFMSFNLVNTLPSLILPVIAWPFSVFLMKQFTQTIPNEILDAGKIDGCSEFRLFINIILPMVKPGLGAVAIFTFVDVWNDYLWQLIMLSQKNTFTLPVGIATFKTQYVGQYGLQMAGAMITAAPMLIIFLVFQKYFIKGITMGSIKG